MKNVSKLLSAALAVSLLTPALTLAQAKPQPADVKNTPAKTADTKATTVTAPTAQEISDARAKGQVWVDTAAGTYYKRGKSFGHTKEGKFMSEADAKAAGFHAAGKTVAKH